MRYNFTFVCVESLKSRDHNVLVKCWQITW